MKKYLNLLILFLVILSSCAKPTVVDITMPEDYKLNCEKLNNEYYETRRFKKEAQNAKDFNTGGNMTRTILFWPALVKTLHNADVAISAADARAYHVIKIMKSKKCKGAGNIDNENIAPAYSSETIAGQLKILQEMYYNGELTKEEYEKAKSKALD